MWYNLYDSMTHGRSLAPSTDGQVHLHSGKHQCKLEAGHKEPAAALDNGTYQTHSSGRKATGPPHLYSPCEEQM